MEETENYAKMPEISRDGVGKSKRFVDFDSVNKNDLLAILFWLFWAVVVTSSVLNLQLLSQN